MTAEVVIMNREAVALAADSAVTIRGTKVLNSANKLYMLAPSYAVGILIFSNATLMGISWELIISLYRTHVIQKKIRLAKLDEYALDFMTFVEKQCKDLFPDEVQEQYFAAVVEELMANDIFQSVNLEVQNQILQTAAPVPGLKVIEIAREVIHRTCLDWENAPALYPDDQCKEIEQDLQKKFSHVFEKLYSHYLEPLKLDKGDKDRLWKHCVFWFTKNRWFTSHYSGIGIVGYGEGDLFPAYSLYNVERYVCGKLKYSLERYQSSEASASIFPLAQDDIIKTVISGMHPYAFESLHEKFLQQITVRYRNLLSENDSNATADEIAKQASEMAQIDFQILQKSISDDMFQKYTLPIMNIVAALPKDELALMAETLVNITSYMRRVSTDLETVGGPTDVAVISKKDGFIWIKRKHYFDAEHNYHFFSDKHHSIQASQSNKS